MLAKVAARFPNLWWSLLPEEVHVPTDTLLGICNTCMNNLEIGLCKEHQAAAKTGAAAS